VQDFVFFVNFYKVVVHKSKLYLLRAYAKILMWSKWLNYSYSIYF